MLLQESPGVPKNLLEFHPDNSGQICCDSLPVFWVDCLHSGGLGILQEFFRLLQESPGVPKNSLKFHPQFHTQFHNQIPPLRPPSNTKQVRRIS